jgi:Mg-chelatase subunit ChlD
LKYSFIVALFFLSHFVFTQNSLIGIDDREKNIGSQENIYKVRADYIIQNNQSKNLYLLRADVEKGTTVRAAKKTIKPNDTTVIVIEFIPQKTGQFKETINLITSADGMPFMFSLTGNIKSIKTDDKTACFYFSKPNHQGVKDIEPILVKNDNKPRDVSNKMPDNSTSPIAKEEKIEKKPEDVKKVDQMELDATKYKPNSILFLIDVSSSMKDSTKLPVMQNALYYLIDNLRETDKISIITYADSVKVLKDGVIGSQKKELHEVVSRLKARGLTKGKKAILFSLDFALMNYIENGNNQIILITDGKFRFYPDDQKLYIAKQGNKLVKLSTVALGNDKDALKNLKEIAEIGKGNFIHIKNNRQAKQQLIDEVKFQSKIQ